MASACARRLRGVIAAAFDGAGAADRGARVVLRHPDRHRRRSALEIGADRRGDDGEDVFRGWLHAEEDLARDHEGPQIETALAARYPGAVDAHELLDRFDEHRLGQRRHRHALGRIPEAPGIGVGAEQVHAAVVALVGLEAFENLLRVVQHGGGRIEREIRAGFDARAMPALRLVVADHRHVIGEDPAEARILQQLRRAHPSRTRVAAPGCISNFKLMLLVAPFILRQVRRLASSSRLRSARLIRLGLAPYRPCGRSPRALSVRTCFCGRRKSSMFAEMPLDNRTVNKFAAPAATSGFFRPLERHR